MMTGRCECPVRDMRCFSEGGDCFLHSSSFDNLLNKCSNAFTPDVSSVAWHPSLDFCVELYLYCVSFISSGDLSYLFA